MSPTRPEDALIRQLERISTHTLLPMLSARQRFHLLLSVLLGHAPVRGGRSRDYPFSADRSDSCLLATSLLGRRRRFDQWASRHSVEISDHAFLVALNAVTLATPIAHSIEEEVTFSGGIRYVLTEMGGPQAEAAGKLLGLAGAGTLDKRSWPNNAPMLKQARLLAGLAGIDVPASAQANPIRYVQSHYGPGASLLESLSRQQVKLLTLQNKRVQAIIDRCKLPFIQRGASYWVSQCVARVREHLQHDGGSEWSLFLDNDAKTTWLAAGRVELLDVYARIRSLLYEDPDRALLSRAWIENHFPRLLPFLLAARSNDQSSVACLPDIEISLRTHSVLGLALDRVQFLPTGQSDPNSTLLKPATHQTNSRLNHSGSCTGVIGDDRLSDTADGAPTWLRHNLGEGYGFAGVAYSLAGLAYEHGTAKAIADALLDRFAVKADPVETQPQLARAYAVFSARSGGDIPLAYVKFDGDHIGQLFLSQAPLLHPGTSIAIEYLIREAWLQATADVIRHHAIDFIPMMLLYFGGDDLLVTMPLAYVDPFLHAFDAALAELPSYGLPLCFTFACVSFSVALDSPRRNYSADAPDRLAILEINKRLAQAKRERDRARRHDATRESWLELSRIQGFIGYLSS